ncbi:serine hydrolase domain-containing protein [Rheinheimera baltica]|uniref:serine hydrolase domain-containing protein n=1 Tax=Rheinheimera baltica TaxID=67576 RepID=UPI00273D2C8B|nr:serine hydrolase domain-containing protein [Rheinheimera baltica]MDP5148954.1 serine hydrolase [Rheinheimera baltica]
MKYFSRLLLSCLLSFWVCQAQAELDSASSLSLSVDKQLVKNANRFGVVGQSVLILKNHHPIYRGVQGYANKELSVKVTPEHIFPSYSVAKLFTSVLVMQLVQSGEVDLQHSIRDYLAYLPQSWQNVTVAHLLNHTSGVPRYFDAIMQRGSFLADKKAVYSSLEQAPTHFKMGTENRYNNTNFLLLASLLELKTKKSYKQLVDDVIVKPLGLQNTGHASARAVRHNMVSSYQGANGVTIKNLDIDWPEYSFAHSALYSTPEDLATFIAALIKGKFVKPQLLKTYFNPMMLSDGTAGTYAFGFEYSVEDNFIRVGHDGGNRVKLRHYYNVENAADNYTLVYMTNGNANDVWTDVLADSVMSVIAPETFKMATLKEQFVEAVLANNIRLMNDVYDAVKAMKGNDTAAVEQFLLYRAYSLKYGSGVASSVGAFEFLVEKFPASENAQQSLNQIKQLLTE